jgi:hypothetical protein
MDTTQLLLATTLIVTTVFLIIVGIQLVFVLRDVRTSLKRINAIIGGFEKVGIGMEHGWQEMLGFFGGLKSFFKVLGVIHHKKNGRHKQT